MRVSIHNVTSIHTEQSRFWSGKDIEFHRLVIDVKTNEGTHSIELFSSQPMELINPQIRVVD